MLQSIVWSRLTAPFPLWSVPVLLSPPLHRLIGNVGGITQRRIDSGTRASKTQYAALPYRLTKTRGIEFLLATSRETGRWIIPKGWPIGGLKLAKAAARVELEGRQNSNNESLGGLTVTSGASSGARSIPQLTSLGPEALAVYPPAAALPMGSQRSDLRAQLPAGWACLEVERRNRIVVPGDCVTDDRQNPKLTRGKILGVPVDLATGQPIGVPEAGQSMIRPRSAKPPGW